MRSRAGAAAGRRVHARVHLEVHVRPTTRVAAGKTLVNDDDAVGVDLLHTAQIVDVGRLLVHRVVAVTVAVPHVDRRAGEGLAAAVDVDDA